MSEYWNHNTAYHRWIIRTAARNHAGDALDVGCGEGLLMQRLAPLYATVTGVEPDAASIERARGRLAGVGNATLVRTDFAAYEPDEKRFDLITFVATLHHMDLRASLQRAAELLRSGGVLLIVGLAANRTIGDWTISALSLPWARLGSFLHREAGDVGVLTAEPHENLAQIRSVARASLPGMRVRRGLYYRYLLHWTKDADSADSG